MELLSPWDGLQLVRSLCSPHLPGLTHWLVMPELVPCDPGPLPSCTLWTGFGWPSGGLLDCWLAGEPFFQANVDRKDVTVFLGCGVQRKENEAYQRDGVECPLACNSRASER